MPSQTLIHCGLLLSGCLLRRCGRCLWLYVWGLQSYDPSLRHAMLIEGVCIRLLVVAAGVVAFRYAGLHQTVGTNDLKANTMSRPISCAKSHEVRVWNDLFACVALVRLSA